MDLGFFFSDPDLLLGPKRHWCTQHELMLNRRFHREMINKATSYVGKVTEEHRARIAKANQIFSTSTAKAKALKQKEQAITADNKRLLKRLLKVEMQQTEITKTNINCPEKQLYKMRRRQRKRATRAAKQFKIDRINRENKIMLQRLRQTKSSFDFNSMAKSYAAHKSRMKVMSKVRDPKKLARQQKQKLASLRRDREYERMDEFRVPRMPDGPASAEDEESLLTMIWKAKKAIHPSKHSTSLPQINYQDGSSMTIGGYPLVLESLCAFLAPRQLPLADLFGASL